LQSIDKAWDAALLAVVATKDAAQIDVDNDITRKWTIQGGQAFGTLENMLAWIEINVPEMFEVGKVKNRHERGELCNAQGIPSQGHQKY